MGTSSWIKNICNYLEKQGVIPINMQLEELALNNKKFDLIVLSHTLEHVSNPKKFIKAINFLLKHYFCAENGSSWVSSTSAVDVSVEMDAFIGSLEFDQSEIN